MITCLIWMDIGFVAHSQTWSCTSFLSSSAPFSPWNLRVVLLPPCVPDVKLHSSIATSTAKGFMLIVGDDFHLEQTNL